MAIDYERLVNYSIPDVRQQWTARDTMLYALSLGLGADPLDRDELRFVYEKELRALPMMAMAMCVPYGWLRQANTGMSGKSVHGEQSFIMHKPLRAHGAFAARTRVTDVFDKGADKGALVVTERILYDEADGALLCTLGSTTYCRGDGGFGGPRGPSTSPHALPPRDPEITMDCTTSPRAALLYRLNGDLNPLHADPDAALKAGFARPILHGLCTFGLAGVAILKSCCSYNPLRLKSMALRFSAPVYPGEALRTEIWTEGSMVSFRSIVSARDKVALQGHAEITQ